MSYCLLLSFFIKLTINNSYIVCMYINNSVHVYDIGGVVVVCNVITLGKLIGLLF